MRWSTGTAWSGRCLSPEPAPRGGFPQLSGDTPILVTASGKAVATARAATTAIVAAAAAAIVTAVLPPPARAVEILHTEVASVTAPDWSAADLRIAIDLSGAVPAAELAIGRIEVPDAAITLADTRVRCGRVDLDAAAFACREARFSIDLPHAGRREFPGEVRYDRRTGALRFAFREVPVAGGSVRLEGTASGDAIAIEITAGALALGDLAALAGAFGAPVEGIDASGSAGLAATVRTQAGALAHAAGQVTLNDASISNEAGTIVTASANARLAFEAEPADGGWRFDAALTADGGETYVEPVYANLAENPLAVTLAGRANEALSRVDLDTYTLEIGARVEARGALAIDLPAGAEAPPVLSGSVELADASVEALYTSLVQVLAAGTLLGDLETAGTVSGRVTFEAGTVTSANLTLDGLTADDRQGRLGVYGLAGVIRWPGPAGGPGAAGPTDLRWDGARVYDIPLGAARLRARLGGDDFELEAPLRIPTMGGALLVNRMALEDYGGSGARGLLDAELEPIELGMLTGAFGWPAFSGTLSGRLPRLEYDADVVTVGGALTARAFDGDIELANLRLEQPFGLVPRLYGDLTLRGLDLEQVTDTFSFGLIQGRLSGDVTGLTMVAWQPVAMDLHLYTPPGDKSRHRISQRAVEDLASVGGGGAGAALSSGFMSFFDEFSYRRIGLRCILADGVCRMSGAGPAGESELGQGYYIVEGRGLPRIDVVGYRHEVSWSRLLRQLVQITQSGGPTIR